MRLKLTGVVKTFGTHRVLEGISLDVETHALVLLGRSGSGKTTLLRVLGGLETPEAGTVEFAGEVVQFEEQALLKYRRTVATVFQSFNLFPHLTALRNLTLPLEEVHRHPPAAAHELAFTQLKRFGLEAHAHKHPAELSGGQRQRVAIARALSIKPRLLLFDEPTSALDPEMTGEVLEMIAELRAEGRDLVLVTHHIPFAQKVAEHAAFLHEGRLIACAPAAKFFEEPAWPEVREFLRNVMRWGGT
jgi:polar amino acid transport system ATP-binding protein